MNRLYSLRDGGYVAETSVRESATLQRILPARLRTPSSG